MSNEIPCYNCLVFPVCLNKVKRVIDRNDNRLDIITTLFIAIGGCDILREYTSGSVCSFYGHDDMADMKVRNVANFYKDRLKG